MKNTHNTIQRFGFRKSKAIKGLGVALLGTFIFGTNFVSAEELSENDGEIKTELVGDRLDNEIEKDRSFALSESKLEDTDNKLDENVSDVEEIKEIPSMIADRSNEGEYLTTGTGFRNVNNLPINMNFDKTQDSVFRSQTSISNLNIRLGGIESSVDNLTLEIKIEEPNKDILSTSLKYNYVLPNGITKLSETEETIGDKTITTITARIDRIISGSNFVIPITLRSSTFESKYLDYQPFNYVVNAKLKQNNLLLTSTTFTSTQNTPEPKQAVIKEIKKPLGEENGKFIQGYKSPDGTVTARAKVTYKISADPTYFSQFRNDTNIIPLDWGYKIVYDKNNFDVKFEDYYGEIINDELLIEVDSRKSSSFSEISFIYKGNEDRIPDTNFSLVPVAYSKTHKIIKELNLIPVTESINQNIWSSNPIPTGSIKINNRLSYEYGIMSHGDEYLNIVNPENKVILQNVDTPNLAALNLIHKGEVSTVDVNAQLSILKFNIPENHTNKSIKFETVRIPWLNKDLIVYGYNSKTKLKEKLNTNYNNESNINISNYDSFLVEIDKTIYKDEKYTYSFVYPIQYNPELYKANYSSELSKDVIVNVDGILPNSYVASVSETNNSTHNFYSNYAALISPKSVIEIIPVSSSFNYDSTTFLNISDIRTVGTELVNEGEIGLLVPNFLTIEKINNSNSFMSDLIKKEKFNELYDFYAFSFKNKSVPLEEIKTYLTNYYSKFYKLKALPNIINKAQNTTEVPYNIYTYHKLNNQNIETLMDDKLDIDNDGNLDERSDVKPNNVRGSIISGTRVSSGKILIPKSLYVYDQSSKDKTQLESSFDTKDVVAGENVVITPTMINGSDNAYNNVSIVTVLSSTDDKVFDGSKNRESQFTPKLIANSVIVPQGWSVLYSTDSQNGSATNITNWQPKESITNWDNVKAIKWITNPGVIVNGGTKIDLGYKLKTPTDATPGSKIVTTSAVFINGSTTTFLEGYRSTVTIKVPEFTQETEEIKGKVLVNYKDTNGNILKSQVINMPETTVETITNKVYATGKKEIVSRTLSNVQYNATTSKLNEIIKDDFAYRFVRKEGSNETGTLPAGTTEVTYIYELVPKVTTRTESGTVKVRYVDTDNNVIKDEVVHKNNVLVKTTTTTTTPQGSNDVVTYSGESYDTRQLKESKITKDTFDYRFLKVKENDIENGEVPIGERTVTYIYEVIPKVSTRTEKGTIKVKYVDSENNEIKNEEIHKNNVLVKTITTTTTPAHSRDTEQLSNAEYNTQELKLDKIVKDNFEYSFTKVKDGDIESGLVPTGERTVTYIYTLIPKVSTRTESGTVKVRYVDTDNNVIKDEVVHKNNVLVKTTTTTTTPQGSNDNVVLSNASYDTTPLRDASIVKDTFEYKFFKVKDNESENGLIPIGEKVITYVYKLIPKINVNEEYGNVYVKYVDSLGNTLKEDVTHKNNVLVKTIITTTTPKGSTDYIELSEETYNTIPLRNSSINKDGYEYKFSKVKDGDVENKAIPIGDTIITYIYNVVPKVTVNKEYGTIRVRYVDTEYDEIKNEVLHKDNVLVKTTTTTTTPQGSNDVVVLSNDSYNTIPLKSSVINKDDYEYRFLKVEDNNVESGTTPIGDKTITYIYEVVPKVTTEEKYGNVKVRWISTTGEILKEELDLVKDLLVYTKTTSTTPKSNSIETNIVDEDYDAREHKHLELTKANKTYYFEEVKSDSAELTGKVEEGTKVITYVYRLFSNEIPNDYPVVELPIAEIETVPNTPPTVELPIKEIEIVPGNPPTVDLPIKEIEVVPPKPPVVELPIFNIEELPKEPKDTTPGKENPNQPDGGKQSKIPNKVEDKPNLPTKEIPKSEKSTTKAKEELPKTNSTIGLIGIVNSLVALSSSVIIKRKK